MENSQKKNWLYGVITLLLLALFIETWFLISKSSSKIEERPKLPVLARQNPDYVSPRLGLGPSTQHRRSSASSSGVGWDLFEEFRRMQEEMNQMFDESFGRATRRTGLFGPAAGFADSFPLPSLSFAVDLQETKEAYIAKADLPGLDKDKIQVNVSGNILTIQGDRHVETEKENSREGFYASGRNYGSFSRSLTLPGPVEESRVTADYKNGLLIVTLPNLKESESAQKKITVN